MARVDWGRASQHGGGRVVTMRENDTTGVRYSDDYERTGRFRSSPLAIIVGGVLTLALACVFTWAIALANGMLP